MVKPTLDENRTKMISTTRHIFLDHRQKKEFAKRKRSACGIRAGINNSKKVQKDSNKVEHKIDRQYKQTNIQTRQTKVHTIHTDRHNDEDSRNTHTTTNAQPDPPRANTPQHTDCRNTHTHRLIQPDTQQIIQKHADIHSCNTSQTHAHRKARRTQTACTDPHKRQR